MSPARVMGGRAHFHNPSRPHQTNEDRLHVNALEEFHSRSKDDAQEGGLAIYARQKASFGGSMMAMLIAVGSMMRFCPLRWSQGR
mmetsp:Transcript_3027/g.5716  ORF Transcript_3027/g.5716 Transcript_3027/m.5716 type:complete len:85 (+) Transcript_3027:1458-1712(+)